MCGLWQVVLVGTVVLTHEPRQLQNVTINRYTFVITNESGINTNLNPTSVNRTQKTQVSGKSSYYF